MLRAWSALARQGKALVSAQCCIVALVCAGLERCSTFECRSACSSQLRLLHTPTPTPLASRNRSHSSSLLPLSRRCKTSHRTASRAAAQMLIGRLSSSACFAQLKLAQSRSMARGVLWKFNSLTPSHSLQLVSVRGLPLNARQKLSGQRSAGGRSRIISSFQVVFWLSTSHPAL